MFHSRFLSLLLLTASLGFTALAAELSLDKPYPGRPLQVTVQGARAGARVQIVEGRNLIRTVRLDSSGVAHISMASILPGRHTLRAIEWGTGTPVGQPLEFVKSGPAASDLVYHATSPTSVMALVAAYADLDGDGAPDLVVVGGNTVVLMHNTRARGQERTFGMPVKLADIPEATAIATQDFDGDGKIDIAVALSDGRVAILLNRGANEFSRPYYSYAGSQPSAVVSADFDGDGIPDLATANQSGNNVSFLFGNGDGTFRPAVTIPTGDSPRALVAADFNGDGLIDIATANFGSNNISILLGNGNGQFSKGGDFAAGNGPVTLASIERGQDGTADLAVLNQIDGNVQLLLNNGSAAFQPGALFPNVSALAVGDFNGDGYSDLVLQSGTEIRVRLGTSDGAFTNGFAVQAVPSALLLSLKDLNNDGRLDLAALDTSGSVAVFFGAGSRNGGVGTSEAGTKGSAATLAIAKTAGSRTAQPLNGGATATSITLTSSANPSTYGQSITLTAFISPSSAVGSVTFYDGTTVLGTKNVGSGQALITTGMLASGVRSLRAYYSGNVTYASSTSPALAEAVNAVPQGGFQTAGNLSVGVNPYSVAVGDFNRDGTADLVTTNNSSGGAAPNTVSVLIGNGNGTFRPAVNYPCGDGPISVAVADFNGDGLTDLAVANNRSGNVSILLGNGDGTFRAPVNYSSGNTPTSVVAGDFNLDGKVDLAVANFNSGSVTVLLGNGDGTFQATASPILPASAYSIAVGDFNGDGKPDLAVTGFNGNTVSVLLGNGQGLFLTGVTYPVGSMPVSVAAGDFNSDGALDLAVANQDGTVSVLLGNGDATFRAVVNYAVGRGATAVGVGDFNGDGKADLVVADPVNSVSVLVGNGDGTFQTGMSYSSGTTPYAIAIGDFNHDGRVDIAASSVNSNVVSIFLGTSATPPLRFVPITPCRVIDTRRANGAFGSPSLAGQSSRDFIISNGACQVPSTAQAFSLNVAVVPQGPLGFLTIWPSGQSQPRVSTLNSDGRTKSNAAIIPAGTNGAVSVFASNTTDVVVDVNGYFVPVTDPRGLSFYPLPPCRVADTRHPNGPLGGPFIAGQTSRSFPVMSGGCGVPATAQAYSINFAAVPRGPLGFLTAWPTGQAKPLAASLNAPTGTVTSNAAILPAGTNGSIDVFASNSTDLVIDINGYFAPAASSGLSLYTLQPCRVLDSRKPAGSQPLSGTNDVNVLSSGCGVSTAVQAYVFNATVVPPGPLGFLTLWAQGGPQPVVSTLNASDGAITGNMAIVPTTNGSISAFVSNPTHLVLDVFGYFAP